MARARRFTAGELAEVFRLDGLGVPRAEIAARFGVRVGTIAYHARRLGLCKRDRPEAADRRRRPAGGWPDGHRFHQGRAGMTPARWRALLTRRLAGEADTALAAEFGVHPDSILRAARRMGMRKMDVDGAVDRRTAPPASDEGEASALAFDYDPARPGAALVQLGELARQAAAAGRLETVRRLLALSRAVRAEARALDSARGEWAARRALGTGAGAAAGSGGGEAAASIGDVLGLAQAIFGDDGFGGGGAAG